MAHTAPLGLGSLFGPKRDLEKARELFEQVTSVEDNQHHCIVIFGRKSCPRCVEVEELLSHQDAGTAKPLFIELDDMPKEECEALRDVLRDLSGSRTVPRVFVRGVPIGGCDDIQELHCARPIVGGFDKKIEVARLVSILDAPTPDAVSIALSLARPRRDHWPREVVSVLCRYQSTETPLEVDCDWDVKLLKRHAVEALQLTIDICELLMLCGGSPFPLDRPAGAHQALKTGAVIQLIDRGSYRSTQVDYSKF